MQDSAHATLDELDPFGLYLGTQSGSLFVSPDGGGWTADPSHRWVSLAAGQETTVEVIVEAPATGQRRDFTLTAVSRMDPAATDQDTVHVHLEPYVDLTVSGLSISPSPPVLGQATTVTATVANPGSLDAGAFHVEVRVDLESAKKYGVKPGDVRRAAGVRERRLRAVEVERHAQRAGKRLEVPLRGEEVAGDERAEDVVLGGELVNAGLVGRGAARAVAAWVHGDRHGRIARDVDRTGLEEALLPVTPAQLQPEQEGVYSMQAPAQDFSSIRLAGLKADPQSSLIAYSSSQGKKRPPERLEPRTIVVKRAGRPGEFLNSPDNPSRVP